MRTVEDRPPRGLRVAWLIPVLALSLFDREGARHEIPVIEFLLPALTGVAAGVVWQLLDRRDLVDRLTFFAAMFAVMIGLGVIVAATGGGVSFDNSGVAPLTFGGILTGLVSTEHWLRSRRLKAAAVARASSAQEVPR